MITLACGQCADSAVSGVLPFVFYWLLIFLAWALLWGIPAAIASQYKGHSLRVSPPRYLLMMVGIVVVAVPVTMGSLLMPMLVFLPVWLIVLFRRDPMKPPPVTGKPTRLQFLEARVRRIVLASALLLIPVGHIRLYVQLDAAGLWPPWQ